MSFHVSLQLLFKSLVCLLSLVLVKIQPSLANPGLSCELPFLCGNFTAGYPFWGGDRLELCGHPSLHLNCEKDDTPTMMISNVTYRVLNVNQEEQLLKIASQEYFQGLCPQKNNTIDSSLDSLLDIANGFQTLELIYGCPKFPGKFNTCNMNKDIINYMDGFIQFRGDISLVPDCNTSVLVPVSKSFISAANKKKEDLEDALKSGFEIKWKVLDCDESCISCGYDAVSNKEICYCQGGLLGNSSGCSDSSKGNKKLSTGAGIGIAVGSAGAVILGLGFFCCIRRRRKTAANIKSKDLKTPPSSTSGTTTTTTTTTTNSSQSNPSHPYTRTDLEKGRSYFGAQVFSCSELEEATDNFNPSKQLGDGGFGAVYLGVLRDGRIVAVKRLYQNNFKRAEQFMNEIEILTKLQHKNLVKLYGCTSRQSRELLLVYEYIPNGTVADHLHNRQSNSCLLPWPVRLSIAIETADALAYLHASDVIHRDVKTNNILLDNNFRVKVADFGLSRLFPTDVTHVSTAPQGTPGYVDPEYFQCYKLTDKSDVYSFGVVLIELISGLQAVDTNRHRYDINLSNMAVKKIQNHALNELVDQSLGFEKDYAVRNMVTSVAELAFRCLQQDREMRPTMKQVLEILRETKDSHIGTQKAEVVEIRMADDAVLLKKDSPTLSPDGSGTGTGTDKWAKIITI